MQEAYIQGIAGGGCVRLANILMMLPASLMAATSTMTASMSTMLIMPCVPLCILISRPLTSIPMQVQSAAMGVK